MKINWKLRLQSKAFWVALASALVLLAQQLGFKVDSEMITNVVNTICTLGIILGVIVDPTTSGLSDSGKALDYETPAPNVKNTKE